MDFGVRAVGSRNDSSLSPGESLVNCDPQAARCRVVAQINDSSWANR